MIVAETETAYRFVTQPAHARLAGQFATHWGNGPFDSPAPREAVLTAADRHDDGWTSYDAEPHLKADGTPVDFTELDASTWTALYDRAVDEVATEDAYAGLLVSLHGTGLRRRRYGLSPSWPDTPPAFEAFVDRQEARQRELLDALDDDSTVSEADTTLLRSLHDTGLPPEDTTSRLWANYRLLQAWDTLSLAVCRTVDPPAYDELVAVPRQPDDPGGPLELTRLGDDNVGVAPYPFEAEPLSVTASARTVEKAAFETDTELVEAYLATAEEWFTVELSTADRPQYSDARLRASPEDS